MEKLKIYKITVVLLSLCLIIETMLFFFWQAPVHKITKPAPIKGKIAIVLDDWGYNTHNLKLLEQIRYPLTLSVLPNLPYSRVIVRQAQAKGKEVILHLPMEPRNKNNLEKNTILVSMDEATIRGIIKKDLSSLGSLRGISNHMGSKDTADVKTMNIIFKELKKKGMYFLDSFVSGDSVCQDLAQKMQIGFAKRDVFIDNQPDINYIKARLYELKLKAATLGQAIGIGHDRKVTLEALKEAMPELEKEGYRFVFVSDLVK